MSEVFDEERPMQPRSSRRSRALIVTAVVMVLLFLGLSTFARLYTDRLWFKSGGYGEVFSIMFWTRTGLFLVFGALMGIVVGVNMYLAFRFRPFFRPSSPEQNGLDRYRDAVTPIRTWLLVGISVVLGAFAGSSAIGQWRSYLLWRHGGSFGEKDRWFGKDIGFYVFELPWLHYLVDFTMAVLVVALIAAAVVHYLYGGIRLQTSRDRLSGAAQVQLSVLLGLFVLAKAADYWLDRFDLVTRSGPRITGMNYTGHNAVLPAKNILLGIAIICAVLFFINIWRRTWLLPSVGLALLAVSAILLGLIWPGIVQQFQVKPSEADKEAPYIEANIKATRAAYDINDVEVEEFSPSTVLSGGAPLKTVDEKTASIPLVDPQLVRAAFEQNQQGRAYYSVADVLDVDRYEIAGNDRALVLGVRELDQNGIPSSDRNWSNLHTVYTHGNGVIAAYANQRPEDNSAQIANAESDSSSQDAGIVWAQGLGSDQDGLARSVGEFEDRIYYGEESPEYSIVGKTSESARDVELNLPTGGDAGDDTTTTYDGSGDAAVGSLFNQLMFAVKYGEPNFVLSGRVNDDSRVLFNRNPRDRVEEVAPWLTVDSDPYPAIVGGRIQWIIDGYTTTDRYPNAEKDSFDEMTDDSLQVDTGLQTLPTDEINYMRNAVKATVDAYSGEVKLYAWDESDPILQAWSDAFPGTVLPKSEISDDLMKHLRYPEDLFQVQRYQYARYHVTNPGDFYQGNNRWEVPEDPYERGTFQPPYRLYIDNPGDSASEVFSVTSVYVPYQKNNLASFVSVDSDATSEDYGAIRVLQLPTTGNPVEGPGQVANTFQSDPEIADLLAQFNRSGAEPRFGNLLTLPVNDGLMYVQPVYASRAGSESSYPILRYVLVSFGGDIGYGPTLYDALRQLVGETGGGSETPTEPGGGGGGGGDGGGTGSIDVRIERLLREANQAYSAAQDALAEGDLGAYQEHVNDAQDAIEEALALSAQRDPEASGGGATEEPSPSPSESATAE
ncbi:UPF0182 family protein [Nocardioides sp. MAH-18]|uniref:UPF0182 protein GON03_05875 n=1 Tax=Nocardioides agri TaxID=2682843 RepID=A0A6L6XPD3_9ACTN|nr:MULTISPECIES: UPF0182 family protein [unclassified Nocardioides]MBA2953837.1 UPF0182 family protein [Nocardioides sp. CGMCC 1.13656]MVQ48702.1 UPF0182 family protein [Nocardioides sp. MAH-18]